MSKKLISYVKKNHETLYYKFVKSEFLVQTIANLDVLRYVFCRLRNEPYFGIYMMAGQTWEERKSQMKKLVEREIASRDSGKFRLLEVGSWAGNSALIWAEAIVDSGCKGEIICVDPWAPYVKPEKNMANVAPVIMENALKKNKIFGLFLHNISAAGISGMIIPIRGTSDEVLPLLKDDKFDVAFIDGVHYFSNVIRDLRNAGKLIKEGGVLCGDDLELQSHEVDLAFAEANKENNFAIDPKTGKEFHPGVCMAVGEFFQGQVSSSHGFWAMRKKAGGWQAVALDSH